MPCDIVRLPCGSMSTQSTRWPSSTNAAARLSVVVVFATPPFWLAKAMTLALPVTARLLGSGGRTIGPGFALVAPFSCCRDSRRSRVRGTSISAGRRNHNDACHHRHSPTSPPSRSSRAGRRRRCSSSSPSAAASRSRASAHGEGARRGLRRGARLDAPDRRRHGPGADQRAADPGDHRADDGPAAGPRRAGGDRVPRLPGAAARPLRRPARRVHLRDPRRAGRVHRLLREADGLAGHRAAGPGRPRSP